MKRAVFERASREKGGGGEVTHLHNPEIDAAAIEVTTYHSMWPFQHSNLQIALWSIPAER